MTAINQKDQITRRGFLERAGALAPLNSAEATPVSGEPSETAASDPALMSGKIARKEHFVFSETLDASYGAPGSPQFQLQLEEIDVGRIAEMDRGGVELCILSLVGPGIQAIPDVTKAIAIARHANDH